MGSKPSTDSRSRPMSPPILSRKSRDSPRARPIVELRRSIAARSRFSDNSMPIWCRSRTVSACSSPPARTMSRRSKGRKIQRGARPRCAESDV